MHLLRFLPAAAAAFLLAAPAASADYVPGEVLVGFEPGADRASIQRAAGVTAAEALPGGAQTVRIADGETMLETLADLRYGDGVRYAVPNQIARASGFLPNDPGEGGPGEGAQLQWNLFGPTGVRAPDAWEIARNLGVDGGRGVVVAVLDTGVAYENRARFRRAPDLHAKRFVKGYDFVDEDPYPNDENGHGTHVTGTIAQRTNNLIGLAGLAYGATIMPLRVLDFQGAGDAGAIARAIRYAARRGADVINMSLEFDPGVRASQIPDIVRAVRYAHELGVVVVAASGNAGNTAVAYPARTNHVISVGATTVRACQAEYSNSGRGLDVVAPGGGNDAPPPRPGQGENAYDSTVCDPSQTGPDIYQQTFSGSSVRKFGLPDGYQGTSMASPHVSATAALIIATRRLGSKPSPGAIEARLKETSRDLGPTGYDRRYGSGLIDTAAAIDPNVPTRVARAR
jgi:serine protease